MNLYILITIIILAIIAAVRVIKGGKPSRGFSKLGILAFFLVIAGIVFSDSRLTSYGLMGLGVIAAIIDMIWRVKV